MSCHCADHDEPMARMPRPRWVGLALGLSLVLGYCSDQVSAINPIRHRQRDQANDLPYFMPTPQNITVHPGRRAMLKCRVENLGTKTVSWRKEGEINPLTIGFFTFSPDTRISLDFNQRNREWSLIIQAVRPEDEGWYHCQVSTKASAELYYPVRLNVLTVQITGTDYVVVNSQLQLLCNATGKPEPPHNVEWLKDGKPFTSNVKDGVLITKKIETKVLVSMLVINSVRMSDKAVYTCRSSNNDEAEFKLHVLDDMNDMKGQQKSPHTGAKSSTNASSRQHQTPTYLLAIVCLTTGLLFQDTRWRS